MQLFATFVKNKCNFFNNFLVQQKLALVIIDRIFEHNLISYLTIPDLNKRRLDWKQFSGVDFTPGLLRLGVKF